MNFIGPIRNKSSDWEAKHRPRPRFRYPSRNAQDSNDFRTGRARGKGQNT